MHVTHRLYNVRLVWIMCNEWIILWMKKDLSVVCHSSHILFIWCLSGDCVRFVWKLVWLMFAKFHLDYSTEFVWSHEHNNKSHETMYLVVLMIYSPQKVKVPFVFTLHPLSSNIKKTIFLSFLLISGVFFLMYTCFHILNSIYNIFNYFS